MISLLSPLFLAAILAISGIQLSAAHPPRLPSEKLRWGVLLEMDRAFYHRGGDEATVRFVLYNGTQDDAHGTGLGPGGNGCEFTFTIVDDQGRIVWEPGTIVDGVFYPTTCLPGFVSVDLPSGTYLKCTEFISLIYQNGSGFGVLGDPLPIGSYRLWIDVDFDGPHREPDPSGPGGGHLGHGADYLASVPFRIEVAAPSPR
jgi:hypothetical protein